MLSKETESKIVNILKTIASGETSIEVTRRLLSDNFEFDPYQIFTNLIKKGNEFITPVDIENYFNSKNIFISYTEAKLLILFYDQNYDGVLTYTEFLPLVQSKNSEKKNIVNSPIREMNIDIDYYLINLFQKEVDLIREIIKQLYDLRIKNDFDCHNIYHAIKNVNKITEDSIGDFFDKNETSFINDELIAIMKRLDINKDGIIDLCELHAFFGFPNCTFCCSCTPCPKCGICCCKECLPDIPCYLHKCIHHQSHSPLETKTLCQSPLRGKNISVSDYLCSKYRNENIDDNINNNISNNNYKFTNLNNKCKYYSSDLNLEDENKSNYDNINNNNYLRNFPETKKNCILENKNLELKNDYSSPHRRYSSPKKYYINSQSEVGSTLYSTSPMNDNFSPTILSKPNNSFNNNNNIYNSYSNSFQNNNQNEFDDQQFKEYLSTLMKIENEIEKGKKELSSCYDFNYEDAFRIFDIECKCCITFDNFKEGLKYIGLELNNDELKLLFNRFDCQKCGSFNCQHFISVLSPCDSLYRNKIERRFSNSNRARNCLSYETKLYFKNVLKLIIEGEKKLNKLREGYSNINNSLRNLFELIDTNGIGYFYENELKNYLRKNGIYSDDKSCSLLFLKLDKNRDGKVDMREIEEEFQIIY